MDLIYANESMEDIGVLLDYEFDLAIGADENNFTLSVDIKNHKCESGYYLYIEGTEYGGIVDSIKVDTAKNVITYKGRTWQGIVASKVLCPDAGDDYLIVTGEANTVIKSLITRMGLTALFDASTENSGLTISRYSMNRYTDAYSGIRKMLATVNGKLKFKFEDAKVILSAAPLVDYSQDEQFDSDQVELNIEKNYKPTNHVICLGKGELKDREVIHLYADENGTVSHTQSMTGVEEVATLYDFPSCESASELEQGGTDMLTDAFASANSVKMSFDNESNIYDIDDVVGAKDYVTGIVATEKITKKIVTISKGKISIEYKVGES